MLIVLIAHFVSLSIVILIFAMIILIALHVWIRCCISFDLTCQFSGLCIILIVFEHDICITIPPDCHSLYVYMSDISCTLLDCMSHDCPSLYDCMSLVCVGCISIHLSPTLWFRSFPLFRFSLLQV